MRPAEGETLSGVPKGMRTVCGRHSGDTRRAGAEGESVAGLAARGESLRQKDRAGLSIGHSHGEGPSATGICAGRFLFGGPGGAP